MKGLKYQKSLGTSLWGFFYYFLPQNDSWNPHFLEDPKYLKQLVREKKCIKPFHAENRCQGLIPPSGKLLPCILDRQVRDSPCQEHGVLLLGGYPLPVEKIYYAIMAFPLSSLTVSSLPMPLLQSPIPDYTYATKSYAFFNAILTTNATKAYPHPLTQPKLIMVFEL